MNLRVSPDEMRRRLASKSRRTRSGCMEWRGATQSRGYGSVCIGAKKTALAHRVAYFLHHGGIDAALTIDHLCRNRRCVNPAHLEQVSNRTNILRGEGFSATNARKTHCDAGHALAGDNLIVKARGSRNCRECQRESERRSAAKYEAALAAARCAHAEAS